MHIERINYIEKLEPFKTYRKAGQSLWSSKHEECSSKGKGNESCMGKVVH